VLERTARPTLVHGDAKPPNLGYDESRLVAIDCGELTGPGPAEIDVVRFALSACYLHCELEPAEMIDIYGAHAQQPLDVELLRLAILADVATYGVGRLAVIRDYKDESMKQRAKDCFNCGMAEFRRAFPSSS
jgi:aminoglycoside phosphotransferase (APT) family kinase protein